MTVKRLLWAAFLESRPPMLLDPIIGISGSFTLGLTCAFDCTDSLWNSALCRRIGVPQSHVSCVRLGFAVSTRCSRSSRDQRGR